MCYICFSWLKPIFIYVNKKINLLNIKNDIDEENIENKLLDEIIILTHKFKQLCQNYLHDIMDYESSNYFKAKKEIIRINNLLTSSSIVNMEGTFLVYNNNYL